MKEKTLLHNFEIIHVPGTSNLAPDAASRYPSEASVANDIDFDLDLENVSRAYAISQTESLPASVTWDEVNRRAASDQESIELKKVIENGFSSSRKELSEQLRYFFSMRDDLYVIENVIFKNKKMLIPKKLRPAIIDGLRSCITPRRVWNESQCQRTFFLAWIRCGHKEEARAVSEMHRKRTITER